MRVLLVEDEVRLADNLAAALRDGPGFAVDWAADGEAGDDAARNLCYDLVILDLMLPKLHGFEVCRMLKASPSTRHIPIFMLTAMASTENKVQGFNLGANEYMTKPFAMSELLARVESMIAPSNFSPADA